MPLLAAAQTHARGLLSQSYRNQGRRSFRAYDIDDAIAQDLIGQGFYQGNEGEWIAPEGYSGSEEDFAAGVERARSRTRPPAYAEQERLDAVTSLLERTQAQAGYYTGLVTKAAAMGDWQRAQEEAQSAIGASEIDPGTGVMRPTENLREQLNVETGYTRSPNLSLERIGTGLRLGSLAVAPALTAVGEVGSALAGRGAKEAGAGEDVQLAASIIGGFATPAGLLGAPRAAATAGRGVTALGGRLASSLDEALAIEARLGLREAGELGAVKIPGKAAVATRMAAAIPKDDEELTALLEASLRAARQVDEPVKKAGAAVRIPASGTRPPAPDIDQLRHDLGEALRTGKPYEAGVPVKVPPMRPTDADRIAGLAPKTPRQTLRLFQKDPANVQRANLVKALEDLGIDAPQSATKAQLANRLGDGITAQKAARQAAKAGVTPNQLTLNKALEADNAARGEKAWTDAVAAGGGRVPPDIPKKYGQLTFGPEWNSAQATDLRDEVTALLGLPRTLKASFDLSAPGRQGLALGVRHPVEWIQSWKPMLKAWKSAEGMAEVNAEIAKMTARWKQQFGDDLIHVYEVGPKGSGLERVPGFEAAGGGKIGGAIRKIPGLGNSERAYATFLNYQKAKTFDNMASALYKGGERNPSVYKNLGNILDHATGYGAAPLKGRIEGQALFSQRYMMSRFQFLTDPIVEGVVKGDWQTARAATENLVAFMGGGAALAMLLNETGAVDVELDPRSPEFGKIRIGPQRIDFGAGFLPLLRTATRVATGQGEATTGSVYDLDRKSEFLKFFRNKLAPIPSEVITRLVGEDAIGESPSKILSLDTVRNLFMPLIADAVLEAYKETDNPLRAALAGVSELVGGGSSAYGSDRAAQRDLAEEQFGSNYDNLNALQQSQINQQLRAEGVELGASARLAPYWTSWDTAYEKWRQDTGALSEYPTLDAFRTELDSRIERTLREQGAEFTKAKVQAMRSSIEEDLGITAIIHALQEAVVEADPEIVRELLKRYEDGETTFEPRKALREIYEEWKAGENPPVPPPPPARQEAPGDPGIKGGIFEDFSRGITGQEPIAYPYPRRPQGMELNPQVTLNAAKEIARKAGIPLSIFDLPERYKRSETDLAYFQVTGNRAPGSGEIALEPGRLTPEGRDRVAEYVPLHEAIHALESAMTGAEKAEAERLIKTNPQPEGVPARHHPPGEGPAGLTNYFDYVYGVWGAENMPGEVPKMPPEIMAFVRRVARRLQEQWRGQ